MLFPQRPSRRFRDCPQRFLRLRDILPPGLRLHAKITLPPGASIGAHVHENETELFYVLQGQGEILQDGAWLPLLPGDATSTGGGQSHALRNTGDADFVLIATIVKE